MATTEETISLREFARRMELAPSAAHAALRRGRIPHEKDGRDYSIPWPEAKRVFEETRDDSKDRRPGRKPKEQSYDLFQARAKKETYLARIRELEFLEKMGDLVDAREVENHLFRTSRQIRDAMLGIPDRLAAVLASETDAAKCHELILSEIERVLEDLKEAWKQ